MAEVQTDNQGSREDTMRFIDMVGLFGTQAMMALGKVINPATEKTEKNLPAARLFVDTLDMLERKTRGNLTTDEAEVLKATLTDLRLMYAEELKSKASEPAPAAADTPAPTATPKEEPPPADPAAAEASKVKFHKNYGEG